MTWLTLITWVGYGKKKVNEISFNQLGRLWIGEKNYKNNIRIKKLLGWENYEHVKYN